MLYFIDSVNLGSRDKVDVETVHPSSFTFTRRNILIRKSSLCVVEILDFEKKKDCMYTYCE